MEKELDLTLRLGLPSPTVETHLSLNTPITDQGNNVDRNRRDNNNNDGENRGRRHVLRNETNEEEGGRMNIDVNIRYYNLIFNHFSGVGETLNFASSSMQPSPAPAQETPTGSDYVLIDVPAKRARRNANANANPGHLGCCGCCLAGRFNETRKCTNLNCNTTNTPMWRKGPLGPKSLCNACGIKFRKEKAKSCNGTE
ncbi:unnamed protein product [Eruca vesicaria subsp. sativa]|uniref:GATA-type domain-containing protein n=1 Tax=Eruca vesicaria subsp. sativa TaxID=29727 RepID=A0ABC8JQJ9_ERUVS|nr:unnamed protein product [Eruca vesicaria subsp. sativa]